MNKEKMSEHIDKFEEFGGTSTDAVSFKTSELKDDEGSARFTSSFGITDSSKNSEHKEKKVEESDKSAALSN